MSDIKSVKKLCNFLLLNKFNANSETYFSIVIIWAFCIDVWHYTFPQLILILSVTSVHLLVLIKVYLTREELKHAWLLKASELILQELQLDHMLLQGLAALSSSSRTMSSCITHLLVYCYLELFSNGLINFLVL